MPYHLNDAKLAWLKDNFMQGNWNVAQLPSYDLKSSANPFLTFAEIPVAARYRFLLEDAQYHVATFIKGPVCNGHAAVGSIDEQFYVFFFDPASDLMIKDEGFRNAGENLLVLPAENGSDGGILDAATYLKLYPKLRHQYRLLRQKALVRNYPSGLSLEQIWNGDGRNPNAVLTVFRHDDNSYVLNGARGDASHTAYVLDYALFERLVYNLVVGFDVFGNVMHQLHTRVYMGMIRMEGENNLLDFLPPQTRQPLRNHWYSSKVLGRMEKLVIDGKIPDGHPTQIEIRNLKNPLDARNELYAKILSERLGYFVREQPDAYNWHHLPVSPLPQPATVNPSWPLSRLTKLKMKNAPYISYFPDVTLIAIRDGSDFSELWTLARNKRFSDIGSLLFDKSLREPKYDNLTLIRDLGTSYPNYLFVVPVEEVEEFTAAIEAVNSQAKFDAVKLRWGRDPYHPRFWADSDRLQNYIDLHLGVQAGVLDYTHYDVWNR